MTSPHISICIYYKFFCDVYGSETLETFTSNREINLNRKFFLLKICPTDLSDILYGALCSYKVTRTMLNSLKRCVDRQNNLFPTGILELLEEILSLPTYMFSKKCQIKPIGI